MSEIKRYDIDWSALYRYDRYPVEDPEGEWVRWEDVKDLLDLANAVVTLGVMEHHQKVNELNNEDRDGNNTSFATDSSFKKRPMGEIEPS